VRLVNAIPRANSDHRLSMPASREVQSRHGYCPGRPGATVV